MKRLLFLMAVVGCIGTSFAKVTHIDAQKLSDPESFSMIVFGDPQGYTKYDINQPLFELSTSWIAGNVDNLNIKAVLFTGDLVEQNENIVRNRNMLNQTSREMYEWSSHCLKRLDNKVPYMIAGGNHEYGYVRGDEGFTHMPEYYTYERNSKFAETLVSTFPNRMGVMSLENSAYELQDNHWGKLLVIAVEWAPRDEVLEWARKLCSSEKYKDHMAILVVHSYLKETSAERTSNTNHAGYKIRPCNHGQEIWDKFVYPCSNVRLVVCGHTGHPGKPAGSTNDFECNTAYRVDNNSAGKPVHQMMYNIQCLGGGWEGNGGDGWLRILEFLPDGETIKVSSYSTLFGVSMTTRHLAHSDVKCNKFEMIIKK